MSYYRVYKKGIVVVNGDLESARTATINLPADMNFKTVIDLYDDRSISIENSTLQISIPPESGRVYMAK